MRYFKSLAILLCVSASLCASALPSRAAVSVDLFGAVSTPDFQDHDLGAGVAVSLDLGQHITVSAEGWGFDTKGLLLDSAAAILRYNITTQTASMPYVLGGYGWNFDTDSHQIHVGLGVEHRFGKHFGLFGEARMLKPLDGPTVSPSAIGRTGIRFHF